MKTLPLRFSYITSQSYTSTLNILFLSFEEMTKILLNTESNLFYKRVSEELLCY